MPLKSWGDSFLLRLSNEGCHHFPQLVGGLAIELGENLCPYKQLKVFLGGYIGMCVGVVAEDTSHMIWASGFHVASQMLFHCENLWN